MRTIRTERRGRRLTELESHQAAKLPLESYRCARVRFQCHLPLESVPLMTGLAIPLVPPDLGSLLPKLDSASATRTRKMRAVSQV